MIVERKNKLITTYKNFNARQNNLTTDKRPCRIKSYT